MSAFECAARATRGARPYQEDAAAVWPGTGSEALGPELAPDPSRLVAVLADGMGGHTGGAIASRTACEAFLRAFAEPAVATPRRLRAGLDGANRALAREVEAKPSLVGMGTTLVGACFSPDGLEWISVGDSPLYFYRRGDLRLVNEDHSLAPLLDKLASDGQLTPAQARADSRRHMLRSAVTGEELDLVDLSRNPLQLAAGDYVILASDGIHTLEPDEIARLVHAYGGDGPAAIAEALIRAVENMRDPLQDNTTIVVVRPLAV